MTFFSRLGVASYIHVCWSYARTVAVFMLCPLMVRPEAVIAQESSSLVKREPSQTARALLEGNIANAAAFRAFRCRYEVTKAFPKSVEIGIAGGYEKRPYAVMEWIVRDGKERRSRLADDGAALQSIERQLGKGGDGKIFGKVSSAHFLTNGHEKMSYSPLLRTANLIAPENAASEIIIPIPGSDSIGPGDKAYVFDAWFKGIDNGTATYEGSATYRGSDLHVIKSLLPAQKATSRLFIDAHRGFLCIRSVADWNVDGREMHSELVILDAKRYANGGWFPLHAFNFLSEDGRLLAREFRVTEMDATPPSDEQFRIELPKGTTVYSVKNPLTQFQLEATMRVGLDDLPMLFERAERAIGENVAFNKMMEEYKRKGAVSWWWLVGGGVLAIVCVMALWRWRQRRLASA